jgi:hypothetical protein
MDQAQGQPEPLVRGIRQSQLERFLTLIREGYPKAELATCFLEERAGINNIPNMANVRDVLSHFATFLDPEIDEKERADQLAHAEEHLRRAIMEPYQIAIEDIAVKVADLYDKYRKFVLPAKDAHLSLKSAPNDVQINARLREIRERFEAGRLAKGRNRWDGPWEEGVKNFTFAFDGLEELLQELERYSNLFDHTETARKHTRLHLWGIAATVIAGILAVLVAYLFYRLAQT